MHMIKSGESLEWVVDQLMSGKRIKNINKITQNLTKGQRGPRTSSIGRYQGMTSQRASDQYSSKNMRQQHAQSPLRSSISPLRPHASQSFRSHLSARSPVKGGDRIRANAYGTPGAAD